MNGTMQYIDVVNGINDRAQAKGPKFKQMPLFRNNPRENGTICLFRKRTTSTTQFRNNSRIARKKRQWTNKKNFIQSNAGEYEQ